MDQVGRELNAYEKRFIDFNVTGMGLEIAPYFNPFFSKEKHNVLYTDYISNEEIKSKASTNPSAINSTPPDIDFVWTPGVLLRQCAPAYIVFDYAVASHVMEHVPNPIRWLNEILQVLKIGGRLRLILPDRRESNDYFRAETTTAELLSWWVRDLSIPSPEQIADFMLFGMGDGIYDGFRDGVPVRPNKQYSVSDAISMMRHTVATGQYIDVHCSVWSRDGFIKTIAEVTSIGLLNIEIVPISDSPTEFTVDLIKLGDPALDVFEFSKNSRTEPTTAVSPPPDNSTTAAPHRSRFCSWLRSGVHRQPQP
ncbi:Methyltransferase domain-containing protein [Pleomorphomonas diazotrophica]|uniref:methyltransferase domain-containing protein n=1 Tax=Pleomorphomonas diazotrophica TaxID=1166257 RepID=UPI0008EB3856|nr:methyltransferase domain-containing protein [Pleomorphomonas diazotrophica]SFM96600.1 Methyltransferase domain-containing protein [Pleomorphomonas diazotrophica]